MTTRHDLHLPWGRLAVHGRPGSGLPLLFLHGTGCRHDDWRDVLAALPAAQPWYSLEFRAHGDSDLPAGGAMTFAGLADDVGAWLAATGLPQVALVGHSLGGMVAMAVAPRCQAVAGMLLLEGWTRLGTSGTAFNRERFFGRLDAAAIADIKARSTATRERFTPAAWDAFWQTVIAADAQPWLARAAIPILSAYGALGRQPGAEGALRVPESPWIRWRWLPDAGHYLPLEAPGATAHLCRELLAWIAAARPR